MNTQNIPQKNVESFCSQMTHFCTDRTAKRPLISKIQVKVYLPQKKKISINFPFFFFKEKSNLVVAVVAVHCRPGATSLVKNFWWKVMFFFVFFFCVFISLCKWGRPCRPTLGTWGAGASKTRLCLLLIQLPGSWFMGNLLKWLKWNAKMNGQIWGKCGNLNWILVRIIIWRFF